jgi:HEPN domain-containing protein
MDRRGLQTLTRDRLADARTLLRAHRYSAAYYMAGYAVECALKACIAKRTKRHDFPDKKIANDSYTHDITRLVGIAGLKSALDAAHASDKTFERYWRVVCRWSEEDRYNLTISNEDALELYDAITTRRGGVMTWLRNHW